MRKTCVVVSHTHWDREWYEPFQLFRMRLVSLMDRLLDILEHDPDFRYFMLDGQTIVLEDYLEIRPERESDLRRYVQEGRLLIGPWYILPDEFLVSGEALLRNLLLGDRAARRFGPKMMLGYIPDPFGHIAQMPQILRGFRIQSAALRRGLDDQQTELFWRAPDGSTVLLCYLRDGYDNAAHLPVHDEQAFAREIARLQESLAPHATTDWTLLMNGTDHMQPMPELPKALQAARAQLPGMDVLHGTLPMYMEAVSRALQVDWQSTPPTAGAELQTISGELRSPKRHHLLPGVLSTRMWIKQRNTRLQTLLEKWAEPFAAFSALTTGGGQALRHPASPFARIWQAWRYLLQNQPHDSICGCSIDQVHREMVTRFDWAEQIGEEITRQSLSTLAACVDTQPGTAAIPKASIPLVIFNPLTAVRTDGVTAAVQVPGSLAEFAVVDYRGQPTPHQVLSRKGTEFASLQLGRAEVLGLAAMVEMISGLGLSVQEIHVGTPVRQVSDKEAKTASIDVTLVEHGATDAGLISTAKRQIEALLQDENVQTFSVRAHMATMIEFCFTAENVPGCGYKTYWLTSEPSRSPEQANNSAAHLENEFLAVDVEPADGTLTLKDKTTGAVFRGLNRFVDGGDRGDEYNYCPPEGDLFVTSPMAAPEISWLERGPACWALQIRQMYRLPVGLTTDRSLRTQEQVEVPIVSRLSLWRGIPRLDIRTEIDNRACDHRLRVYFPSALRTNHSTAEGAFDVVERSLGIPAASGDWVEQPVPTHPQLGFTDVSDGRVGLLVANRGLPECEVLCEPNGSATIALTLLRCIGWLSRDDLPCRQGHAGPALETPEAQCLGPTVMEYALIPHGENPLPAYTQAHAFNVPLRATGTTVHTGALPPTHAFVQLQGERLVLSAVKTAESGDGLIVRFYNAGDEAVVARLETSLPTHTSALVDLAELEINPVEPNAARVLEIRVGARQITTVKMSF